MKKSLSTIILLSVCLYSDTIGGEFFLGLFNHSPHGYATYKTPINTISSSSKLDETLGFKEEQDIFLKAYFEHPFPFIPNIKLSYNTLTHTGTNSVSLFSWGDIINFTGTIQSSLSLDMSDASIYYELLDNWLELDAGLTFRYIAGDLSVQTARISEQIAFSTLFPMFYTKTQFNIPATDLSIHAELNAISFNGISSYDYSLSARYTLSLGIGIEGGYKAFYLESHDLIDGFDTNINFKGPFVAATWDF